MTVTPVAVTRETLNLSSEGPIEIREVASDPDNWIEIVTTQGDLLLTLNDPDCSNLINALTNVWRARVAGNLEQLQETRP